MERRRGQFDPGLLTFDLLVERGLLPAGVERSHFWAGTTGEEKLKRQYPQAFWLNALLRGTAEYKLIEMVNLGSEDIYLVEYLLTGKFPEIITPLRYPEFRGSDSAKGSLAELVEKGDLRNETLDLLRQANLPGDILRKAAARTCSDIAIGVYGEYGIVEGSKPVVSYGWDEKAKQFGEPMTVAEAKDLLESALGRESGRVTWEMVEDFQGAIPEDWRPYGTSIYTDDGFHSEPAILKILADHGWPVKLYPWQPWEKNDQVQAWIDPKVTDGLNSLLDAIDKTPESSIAYLVEDSRIPALEILLGLREEIKSEEPSIFRWGNPDFLRTHRLSEEIVRAALKRVYLQTADFLRGSRNISSWYPAEECEKRANSLAGEPLTPEQMIEIAEAAYQRVSETQPELVNPPNFS